MNHPDLPVINAEESFLHYVKNVVLDLNVALEGLKLKELQVVTDELLHNINEKLSVMNVGK